MNCYETIDLMGDALDGCLPRESRAGFDEHLEECPACRTYLEQLRATIGAVGQMPRRKARNPRAHELIDAFRRRDVP